MEPGDDGSIPEASFGVVHYVSDRPATWRDALRFYGPLTLSLVAVILLAWVLPSTTALVWRVAIGVGVVVLLWAVAFGVYALASLRRSRRGFREMVDLAREDPDEFRRRYGPPSR